MAYYVGIDASLETVNICIVDEDGDVAFERKIEAEPSAIVAWLKRFGRPVARVGLEAGPTASWLFAELRAAGLPAICMECRHVKAGLGAMRNKTDRNDARGIAQLVRLGWFRHVFVKSDEAQRIRMLLVARTHLVSKSQDLENCIRGSLKVFGLRIGTVTRQGFEARVLDLIDGSAGLALIVEPLLRARRAMIEEFERLDRLCRELARRDPVCRRLMSVPGVGVIVALTYRTDVDVPERFKRSRDVGAHFGLTPRRYSSGQTDYDGRISRCGDEMVRTALYQAAHVLLHHGRWSSLRAWAMRIAKRRSLKAAKVALARKLAVVMHRMWVDGTDFRWSDTTPACATTAAT
ncbi:Transposase [Poseidonocella pacifica]|uniref:Transposase n=1 Tax=Poseidonocella pacifica TaxID=871651 RepID=A0A1I0WFB1_9RHOB|nr:IS110 family transposase [Poseidonocella pacifica]SFA86636.1 Transposase [Poseidonocella pacifica]